MPLNNVYFLVVAICFIIVGAIEIWEGRCLFFQGEKYTKESMRAFAKHDGCVEIALGAAAFALRYGAIGRKVCLVILIGALTYYSVQMSRILQKK